MRLRYSSLLVFFTLIFMACHTKEEIPVQNGTLKLGSIDMVPYQSETSNNARFLDVSTWNHVYKAEATLRFKNTKSLEDYTLNFNPNTFPGNYQLVLPYGDYTYSTEVTGNDYENFLPFEASGTFKLDAPTLEISLEATSEYGLITVENENIEPNPILIDGQNQAMNLKNNFYFKYVKKGKNPELEITEDVFNNKIRRTIQVDAYKHYNYVVRVSDGSSNLVDLVMTDFELIEEELWVNIGTVPNSYNPIFASNLSSEINESSGLAFFNGQLWTINDADKENIIYQFNPTNGTVGRRVTVSNAINVDWESMAQSETHLFIGDFGNNHGTRKNLTILKINKSLIASNDVVTAEKITFQYPDQTNFSQASNNHNFDCEAFFFSNDSLHLFSKNWVNSKTKYYTLSAQAGNYQAKLKMEYNVEGLITAADINPVSGDIVLLGYENQGLQSQSFVWLLSGYDKYNPFSGKKSKIKLGSPIVLGQTEGIFLNTDNTGYISSEIIQFGSYTVASQLYSFDFKNYF